MLSREEAKQIRRYLNEGGAVYEGLCKPGSYLIAKLEIERIFNAPLEETHGRSS